MMRRILEGMLKTAPQSVIDTMARANSTLCIIGRYQKLTDLPPFAYMASRATFDGRDYSGLAGVGAVVGAPEVGPPSLSPKSHCLSFPQIHNKRKPKTPGQAAGAEEFHTRVVREP